MANGNTTLAIGTTYQCNPISFDQHNQPMAPWPTGTTYVSDTPAVATVDTTGLVTAVAAGTATVTLTNSSLTATLAVTVYVPVSTTTYV